MTATAAGFKSLLPEFASTADARVDMFLVLAGKRVDPKWFSDLTDYAIYYLAAHLLSTVGASTSGSATPAGPLTSEKVGEVSLSYAAPSSIQVSAADSEYLSTKYGRQFLSMRGERVMSVIVPGLRGQM